MSLKYRRASRSSWLRPRRPRVRRGASAPACADDSDARVPRRRRLRVRRVRRRRPVRPATAPPDVDAGGADGRTDNDGGSTTDAPRATPPSPAARPNKDGDHHRATRSRSRPASTRRTRSARTRTSRPRAPGRQRQAHLGLSGALASDVRRSSSRRSRSPASGTRRSSPARRTPRSSRESSDLLGVFETSPGALLLRGVVSPTESSDEDTSSRTRPPVSVLKFPLDAGRDVDDRHRRQRHGAGRRRSRSRRRHEKYESKVDAAGELKTPLGTFDVLRVADRAHAQGRRRLPHDDDRPHASRS